MTGLRELNVLDNKRHNPAIGINYGKTELGRLLIVGLSHYDPDSPENVRRSTFTQEIIQGVIDGKRHIAYFTKIAELFHKQNGVRYSPAEFYSSVGFYNFLQDPFAGPKEKTPDGLFKKAEPFFRTVLERHTPDRVLMTGKRLWQMRGDSLNALKPGTNCPLPQMGLQKEEEKRAWKHRTTGQDHALVAGIYHPSSPKFQTLLAKTWIPTFMKFTSVD